ncbi:hypothetical protein HJD18_08450 [Thermoleophilia bacterium SCSIO 60948]|nr:hypothetical protein HJD18_08450 [Thermoleophilia bacterium SCSIO 60948]
MTTAKSKKSSDSGWAAFAGVVMIIVGTLDAIWGLGGVLDEKSIIVGGGKGALIADLTLWGWVHLLLGIVIAATGFGLLTGRDSARWTAIVLLSLNAISQVVWFTASPLWAFLLILLDVTVIYQLTVRWERQAYWD